MEAENANHLYLILDSRYGCLRAVTSRNGEIGFRQFIVEELQKLQAGARPPLRSFVHYEFENEKVPEWKPGDSEFFKTVRAMTGKDPEHFIRLNEAMFCVERDLDLLTAQTKLMSHPDYPAYIFHRYMDYTPDLSIQLSGLSESLRKQADRPTNPGPGKKQTGHKL